MNLAKKLLLSFCEGRKRIYLRSDGDWDGIAASSMVSRFLIDRGFEVKVEFPHPKLIKGMKVDGCILIELPMSKGLIYSGSNLLIDHHGDGGEFTLFSDSKIKEKYMHDKPVSSVAELVKETLEVDLDPKLMKAINLIDLGRDGEDEFSLKAHRAYLLNLESEDFRLKAYDLLLKREWKRLAEIVEEESRKWRRVEEKVKEIKSRAEIHGGICFTWYDLEDNLERTGFREAMLKLEEENPVVAVMAIKEGKVEKVHLGSKDERIDVGLVLRSLKISGILSGGKKQAGGISFQVPVDKEKAKEIVIDLFSSLV